MAQYLYRFEFTLKSALVGFADLDRCASLKGFYFIQISITTQYLAFTLVQTLSEKIFYVYLPLA